MWFKLNLVSLKKHLPNLNFVYDVNTEHHTEKNWSIVYISSLPTKSFTKANTTSFVYHQATHKQKAGLELRGVEKLINPIFGFIHNCVNYLNDQPILNSICMYLNMAIYELYGACSILSD